MLQVKSHKQPKPIKSNSDTLQGQKNSKCSNRRKFIKNLTSPNKRTAEKAIDKYNETIKDLKKSKPLNERIAENKGKDTYLVNFQLYTTRKSRNTIKPSIQKIWRTILHRKI